MTSLFRPEAIQHATRRLGGDLVLISPLSVWLLGGLLASARIGFVRIGHTGQPALCRFRPVDNRHTALAGKVQGVEHGGRSLSGWCQTPI